MLGLPADVIAPANVVGAGPPSALARDAEQAYVVEAVSSDRR
jgi:hypothetical protein